jgi:hypothetical protein
MHRIARHPLARKLNARSIAWISKVEASMPSLMLIWVALASFACGLRISSVGMQELPTSSGVANILSYTLVVAAPVCTIFLALRLFPAGRLFAQPGIRLARFGRWREIDGIRARKLALFGASGFMASLVLGMLVNVPVRVLEFLTAIPALSRVAPDWFLMLRQLMLVDVVVMSCLYCFAAIMALRHVPLFPRFLVATWGIDLLMQTVIARTMGAMADLPPEVAHPLHAMLEGNVKKALISVALWLPYLMLSKRVNLTYRLRQPA